MFSRGARYWVLASPPSYKILPEALSDPADLFLPNAANLFIIILVLMAKGSHESSQCVYVMLRSQLNTEK
jgi:hypothetical protein